MSRVADDPPPYKDGVRINSPHYLCKMVQEKGSTVYNLVLSQYEKNNSIYYTLRIYSTAEFSFSKISEPYNAQYEKQVSAVCAFAYIGCRTTVIATPLVVR